MLTEPVTTLGVFSIARGYQGALAPEVTTVTVGPTADRIRSVGPLFIPGRSGASPVTAGICGSLLAPEKREPLRGHLGG